MKKPHDTGATLLQNIVEAVPIRIFWKGPDLRYLGCNTLFAKDAGCAVPEQLIGKTDFDMGWKDQAESYRADDRQVMESGKPKLGYEEPQTTPDGKTVWLRTSKVPLYGAGREVIGILGIYEDITEQKRVAAQLLESEEKFKAIFDTATDGILVTDMKDKRLLMGNAMICRMLGYSPEEIANLHIMDLHREKDLPYVLGEYARHAGGDKDVAENIPVRRKDGSIFYAEITVAHLNMAGVACQVGFFRDISERKKAEEAIRLLNEELEAKVQARTRELLAVQEELVRKEKLALLGQVADTVGHELRNPLGVMNNAVYFLQAVLADADETTKEYLGIIKDEIGDAERIVSDLLDAVRTKPPQPETVDVAELIGNALKRCTVPPAVTVRLDMPESPPLVRVDPVQMRQVFWNLVTNAVEAMPDGGLLEIMAKEDPAAKTVTIGIRDSGSGITPEHQARLFQPMFTTKARRIGLGLVVVKNLTQANGGSVRVESEPGRGSTFSIVLPCD